MQTRAAKRAREPKRASRYSVFLLLLFVAPVLAQSVQPAPPSGGPPSSVPPAGKPPSTSMDNFVPALPPSVVPPRLEAPYPCRFSHSAVYEHPTGPTIVTFTVTAQGRVTNTSIAQSSGSAVVDDGVRNCVSSFIYAPAIRDGQPVDVTWAYEYTLTITNGRGSHASPGLPPNAPQGTKLVMMPVAKYRSSVGDCERWHGDVLHPVLVAFDVETDGSVKNASVVQSSGDAAVDKDAVDCVSRRQYEPATRDGEPVEIRLTTELFGPNRE